MSYTFTAVTKHGSITKFEMGSSQTCSVLLLWRAVKPWVLAFYTNHPIENFMNKLYSSEEDLVRVGLKHFKTGTPGFGRKFAVRHVFSIVIRCWYFLSPAAVLRLCIRNEELYKECLW